eukprot:3984156-Pyramimonas_sp.AAC.1
MQLGLPGRASSQQGAAALREDRTAQTLDACAFRLLRPRHSSSPHPPLALTDAPQIGLFLRRA